MIKKAFRNKLKKRELTICLLKKNCKFAHSKIIKFLKQKEYCFVYTFSNMESFRIKILQTINKTKR